MSKLSARKSRRVSTQRSKNRSWKSFKILKKAQSFLKLVVFAIFAIVVSIGVLAGASFYKIIKTPLAASFKTDGKLDNIYTISVIEVEDKEEDASKIKSLSYLVVNTLEKKVLIYNVPPDLELDLPERFGRGTISKAYALGELVEKNKGIDLVNKTLSKIFARKADRYVLTDQDGIEGFSKIYGVEEPKDFVSIFALKNLPKAKESLNLISSNFESNLTPREFFDVARFFSLTTPSQIKTQVLEQADLDKTLDLDKKMESIFVDPDVINEDKRIIILNGADIPKLGIYASRFIEGFGGSVVGIDNASNTYQKSLIVVDNLDSKTAKLVSSQLGIKNVVSSEAGKKMVNENIVGADIVVILGIDYASSL